jgi:hypothetical protein
MGRPQMLERTEFSSIAGPANFPLCLLPSPLRSGFVGFVGFPTAVAVIA